MHISKMRLIATKVQTNAYSNLQEMERDLLQMVKNACQFNEPGSQIYKDARTLKKIFMQKRLELETGKTKLVKRPKVLLRATIASLKEEVDSSDDEETSKKGEGPMWALFDHLYNAPGFSEHTKLNKGEYANISDLTADLYLMLENAKKAYPPTHRTHKDAVKMLKLMNAKLVEDTLDQETIEMEEEEDEQEEEEEDDEVEGGGDALVAETKTGQKKKGRPRVNNTGNNSTLNTSSNTTNAINSPKAQRMTITAALRKKVLALHKYLLDFSMGTRKPIHLFMEKPPRKVYPDYVL